MGVFFKMKYYLKQNEIEVTNVEYNEDEAHRADYDAEVTSQAFMHMIHTLDTKFKVTNIKDIDNNNIIVKVVTINANRHFRIVVPPS